MNIKNFLSGFGGAIVLNILHESFKHSAIDSPRIDKVGEEAVQKTLGFFGKQISNPQTLYNTTLAGDLLSNAAYYSMIAKDPTNAWSKALSLGLTAGIGAVMIPEKVGLNDKPVAKNTQRQVLTVGFYVAGALATAAIVKLLAKK
ncbi:hypothetical protein GV828_00635 [Flavobacterium sp. NST-5]|uniref:Uncharacterized protein n=1 Tax=Flavobacterium ichthyis TaxID=2698827 RepID=A0ABW9Z4S9_9FLAO|nr:hypothetical protein [Flavobacterium ichthyis]NBL63699.1 hypothetical protein [Flavobacterium ichthyis]